MKVPSVDSDVVATSVNHNSGTGGARAYAQLRISVCKRLEVTNIVKSARILVYNASILAEVAQLIASQAYITSAVLYGIIRLRR